MSNGWIWTIFVSLLMLAYVGVTETKIKQGSSIYINGEFYSCQKEK